MGSGLRAGDGCLLLVVVGGLWSFSMTGFFRLGVFVGLVGVGVCLAEDRLRLRGSWWIWVGIGCM